MSRSRHSEAEMIAALKQMETPLLRMEGEHRGLEGSEAQRPRQLGGTSA
jgi:hypothetical protein